MELLPISLKKAWIKGWAVSKHPPDEKISVFRSRWLDPMSDSLELKLNQLHFGKVVRGRQSPNTKIFTGDSSCFRDMDRFVPTKLSKRQITSKVMGIFDIRGILIPLTARLKRDLRDIFRITPEWDHAVTPEQKFTWVQNFLDVEKCKGIKFHRPRMPGDAFDTKMRLWVLVDAAKELMSVWSAAEFKRRDSKWSCAFLVARCGLVPVDCTIPRGEMEALVAGSKMIWILRTMLSKWVDSYILAGDAKIPLFWVLQEKNRLVIWHRSRSVQIRRGIPLDNIYHVTTEANVADVPTRPDKLTISNLGPGSDWDGGRPWMQKELSSWFRTELSPLFLTSPRH